MSEPSPSNFKPRKIDKVSLLAIGRIVRACAELEDMLTLFICNLGKVPEGTALVMLGRSSYSTKLSIAQYLAKMRGPAETGIYKAVFDSTLKNGTRCRNHVAHGVYLGMNQDRQYGFLTANTIEPENGAAVQEVHCYSKTTLCAIADAMETFLPLIEIELKIEPLRERRQRRSLPHLHKGRNQPRASAKRKPRPQSSPG
jgi:hypothetical protein